jgi:hypothetical protein
MNSLKFIVIILSFVCSQLSNAQTVLKIKSRNTSEIRIIKNESKIQIKVSGDSTFTKGEIQLITDSSLVILMPEDENTNLKEFKFKDIAGIIKPTKLHAITKILGAPFMIVGGIMFIGGTMSTISPRDGSNGPATMGIGAGALVLGILPYLIKPKTYDLTKDYTLIADR